jgi:hypothetical protein
MLTLQFVIQSKTFGHEPANNLVLKNEDRNSIDEHVNFFLQLILSVLAQNYQCTIFTLC